LSDFLARSALTSSRKIADLGFSIPYKLTVQV